MKRISFIFFALLCCGVISAQAYKPINIVAPDYVTIESSEGITVQSIECQSTNTFLVTFYNTNRSTEWEMYTHTFTWYFSYKGRRVSDYYSESIRTRRTATRTAVIWPGEVPAGYEKYVTIQFGKESFRRDSRDDE